mmetsp:Transcript_31794/g.66582  ORF Transcript_31794/g.66582 Transcript_31794/m.66582 type:complete len:141 (+) Transcript_31794:360-782(+)
MKTPNHLIKSLIQFCMRGTQLLDYIIGIQTGTRNELESRLIRLEVSLSTCSLGGDSCNLTLDVGFRRAIQCFPVFFQVVYTTRCCVTRYIQLMHSVEEASLTCRPFECGVRSSCNGPHLNISSKSSQHSGVHSKNKLLSI